MEERTKVRQLATVATSCFFFFLSRPIVLSSRQFGEFIFRPRVVALLSVTSWYALFTEREGFFFAAAANSRRDAVAIQQYPGKGQQVATLTSIF